jgi:orotate phosphoribosyltransferase
MYVEVKAMFGNPAHLRTLAAGLWDLFDRRPTCVAAGGYGGLPLATAISVLWDVSLTLVRELPKGHGKGGQFEGLQPSANDVIAVVDDKIVTGQTIRQVIAALSTTGATTIGPYVVVDASSEHLDPVAKSIARVGELI